MIDTTLSPEHAARRVGRLTASRLHEALAQNKSKGWSTSRANYATELLIERLTGQPVPHYKSRQMLRGIELEPDAVLAYEWQYDVECEPWPGGFVDHPTIPMCGASPDRIVVGTRKLAEFKSCVDSAMHVNRLLGDPFGNAYELQGHWQLECTGFDECDLVSFDDRFPPGRMRLLVHTIKRDEKKLSELRKAVTVFLGEVETRLDYLVNKYGAV